MNFKNLKVSEMIQIVKVTLHDDKDASQSIEIMPCASIMSAKEVILNEINKEFDGSWKSLDEAANALNGNISECGWNEETKMFQWQDNGKGETYIIARINERELNKEFKQIGTL